MNPAQIIKRPIISEKTTALVKAESKCVFEVDRRANKNQIKEAVEKLFGVKVLDVGTAMVHGKKVRLGKTRKFKTRPSWKKAVVKLEKGQKIEVFEVKK